MEQPKKFTTVLSVSFLILTAMYIPVAAGGYHMLAYGLFPGCLELVWYCVCKYVGYFYMRRLLLLSLLFCFVLLFCVLRRACSAARRKHSLPDSEFRLLVPKRAQESEQWWRRYQERYWQVCCGVHHLAPLPGHPRCGLASKPSFRERRSGAAEFEAPSPRSRPRPRTRTSPRPSRADTEAGAEAGPAGSDMLLAGGHACRMRAGCRPCSVLRCVTPHAKACDATTVLR
jgi:hypothetical protein